MLRLTKCKDSENDGHNAAMRTSQRKCAHWVLKMFISQIQFCVLGNCKSSSYQQTDVVFTQMWSLFLLQCNWDTELVWTQDEGDSTVCCQCGHMLHRTVSITWINVLSCIPCTSPAAVEHSYYIPSWHGKLATVSRHIFLSLSLLSPEKKKRKYWLARLLQARPHFLKEKGWINWHKNCVPHFIQCSSTTL